MTLDFLEWFGCVRYQKDGYNCLTLPADPAERAEMRSNMKAALKLMDKNVYAINTNQGSVVTAGHECKTIRTAYY